MSIDIDLRSLVDYLAIKALDVVGLPDSMDWVYRFLDPRAAPSMPPEKLPAAEP